MYYLNQLHKARGTLSMFPWPEIGELILWTYCCWDNSIIYYTLIAYIFLCNCRILIIFADGLITLWAIQESKAVFTIGGSGTATHLQETKTVTAACWVCPFGSKVAVGYDTGDISIYTILSNSDIGSGSPRGIDSSNTQHVHTSKINLVYRLEKIPIASLKWVYSDGKANRLYVIGAFDATSTNLVQVYESTSTIFN